MLKATGGTSAAVRYVDPLTSRDALPTMRTEMLRLVPGHRTASTRSVGSSVFQVYQGAGSSVIAGTRYNWAHGDIFVVPSWAAVDHEAAEPADLFVLTDRPIIEALGLNREEELPEHQEVREISEQ